MERSTQDDLTQAIHRKDLALVIELLASGAELDGSDHAGLRPLHRAARECRVEILRHLLKAGADPNAEAPYTGDRPAHLLFIEGWPPAWVARALELLAAHGADLAACNAAGVSPRAMARRMGQVAIAATLPEDPGEPPLDMSAEGIVWIELHREGDVRLLYCPSAEERFLVQEDIGRDEWHPIGGGALAARVFNVPWLERLLESTGRGELSAAQVVASYTDHHGRPPRQERRRSRA